MKSLFLTRGQAECIAEDLREYLNFKDSSMRELFDSFEIRFDDSLAEAPHMLEVEIYPKANRMIVDADQ